MVGKYRDVLQTTDGFAAFYRAQSPDTYRYFASRVYDPQVAFDLTAETFAQALKTRHRFRGDKGQAVGWLSVIARRQLSGYYRRGYAEKKAVERLHLEVPRLTGEGLLEATEFADQVAQRDELRDALAQLSSEHRRALTLRIVEDRSYATVAAALGVTESTARARVSRALRALSEAVKSQRVKSEVIHDAPS